MVVVVLVLKAVKPGIRGYVTRWLWEVAPGVYVGNLSARVRELLWQTCCSEIEEGQAIFLESVNNEQGYKVSVHGDTWRPVDLDGLVFLQRPDGGEGEGEGTGGAHVEEARAGQRYGWSIAARRRRFRS